MSEIFFRSSFILSFLLIFDLVGTSHCGGYSAMKKESTMKNPSSSWYFLFHPQQVLRNQMRRISGVYMVL